VNDAANWPDDTPGRLEQAALALFERHGFESVSCADIAEAAGVSERTFFRHFAHKEDVLLRDSQARLDRLRDALADMSDDVASSLAGALAAAIDERDPAFRLRARLLTTSPSLVRRNLELQVQWEEAISESLQGILPEADAAVIAAAAVACARVVVAGTGAGAGAGEDAELDTSASLARSFRALWPLTTSPQG